MYICIYVGRSGVDSSYASAMRHVKTFLQSTNDRRKAEQHGPSIYIEITQTLIEVANNLLVKVNVCFKHLECT